MAQPPQQQSFDYNQSAPLPAQQFNQQQLASLVAPVALYPDALLSQILVAATYPMELQQAAQWLQSSGNLSGPDLVAAAGQQPWDASVQALVVFPDVLSRLTSNMQWTTDLGNAFIAQQGDVMNAVQGLRAQARASGRLVSTPQQNVIDQGQGGQDMIEIQPADQETVYVPNYNPEYVWGAPAYGYAYPSLYYPSVGFGFGYGIPIGRYFGGGFGWGGWGWRPNWYGHSVIQNNGFFSRYRFNGYRNGGGRYYGSGSATWAHNPQHRMGVPYGGRSGAGFYNGGGRYQQQAGPRYNNGGFNRGYSAPEHRSAPSPGARPNFNNGGSRGNYGSGYQSSPNRSFNSGDRGRSASSYQQSPSRSFGNDRGRSSTPSYQQHQPSPSRGSGYQASPRNFNGNPGGGHSTPSRSFQSSPSRQQASPRINGNNNGGGSRPTPSRPSGGSNNGHGRHGK